MKKDRNCGNSFPIYPTYPMSNMMPGIPAMGGMMPYSMDMNVPYSDYQGDSSQISKLNSQISSLERRVSNLENLVGNNSNSYNTSNYQML